MKLYSGSVCCVFTERKEALTFGESSFMLAQTICSAQAKAQSGLLTHQVHHLDLTANNLFLCCFDLVDHFLGYQGLVVFIHCIADAVLIQPINVKAGFELPVHYILNN